MLELDGARGEGGGQIVRTALALASATGTGVRVRDIRASRPEPGLRPQHAAVARAFARITGGALEGAEVGSREVRFAPGPLQGGELHVDIGTAGSVPLFLQALMPALAAGEAFWRVTVDGGTDTRWAPPWDHFAKVHVDTLERLGWRPRARLLRRGWYPKGGGGALLEAGPWTPRAFDLRPTGKPWQVRGRIAVSGLPDHVPRRIRDAALARLAEGGVAKADLDVTTYPSLGPGVVLVLWADDGTCLLGGSSLGEQGKPSEQVGREAAEALLREMQGGGSVDAHAADQLLPYAGLAAARTRDACAFTVREATPHARTNAEVVEAFLPVRVAFEGEGPVRVRVAPA